MRTTNVILGLLATAILAAPPTSAAPEGLLFEDAAGDVGPWPTMILGTGLPGPAWADLLGASAAPVPDGTLTVTLEVATVPADLPPDVIWAVEWTDPATQEYVAVGYASLKTPEGDVRGAALCVFEKSGEYGPEGEPECAEIPADVATGSPGSFEFQVPAERAIADVADPGGVTLLAPDATAFPLFVLHFTGMTVLDVGWTEGEVALASAPEGELATAAVSDVPAQNSVPPAGPLAAAAALGIVALASASRRR